MTAGIRAAVRLSGRVLGKNMNGVIAQIVAITCHGNAFITGIRPVELTLNNSAFTFCDRISFSRTKKSVSGELDSAVIANSPNEWFSYIQTNGCIGIRLSRIPQNFPDQPDRTTAGLVNGGGIWVMEAVNKEIKKELWAPRWDVWDKNAPGQRIWRVVYGQLLIPYETLPVPKDMNSIHTDLLKILQRIHHLAEKTKYDTFAGRFRKAIDTLESEGQKLYGYHNDLAPEGIISKQGIAILDACQSAWVFGAMGSWNDINLEGDDREEYEIVSEKLFNTVCEAICIAVNESYRSH
jgi:hypothetical protein